MYTQKITDKLSFKFVISGGAAMAIIKLFENIMVAQVVVGFMQS